MRSVVLGFLCILDLSVACLDVIKEKKITLNNKKRKSLNISYFQNKTQNNSNTHETKEQHN